MFLLSPFGYWLNKNVNHWYLQKVDYLEWIIPLRFLLLNVAMVPSTMKVTLELIKIMYTVYIHKDEHL